MSTTVIERYTTLVNAGEIERDPAQLAVAARLSRLEERLARHRLARQSSQLGWLFGGNERKDPIKGLYIYREGGRGQTKLVGLFFDMSAVKRRARAHFHQIIADIPGRLKDLRRKK